MLDADWLNWAPGWYRHYLAHAGNAENHDHSGSLPLRLNGAERTVLRSYWSLLNLDEEVFPVWRPNAGVRTREEAVAWLFAAHFSPSGANLLVIHVQPMSHVIAQDTRNPIVFRGFL